MPYIKREARKRLDSHLEELGKQNLTEGELNYCLTRLLLLWVGPEPGYTDYNAAIGAVECAKLELYRRALALYEDNKCVENGDVYVW